VPVRRRVPILAKLLGAYLVPTVAAIFSIGYLSDRRARLALDEELGKRLTTVASSAAAQIADENLSFLAVGDESTRIYRNVQRRLEELRAATGVARLYIFAEDRTSRADTQAGVPIGERYFRLDADAAELRRAFAGTPAASVLFRGKDGAYYKSGYAAIKTESGAPAFAVGADAAASFYEEMLSFRNWMLAFGTVATLAVVVVSVSLARRLTAPLRSLARAAERIGQGDLDGKIDEPSRDEIGLVAETMEAMRAQLRTRDERMQMMLAGIAHEVRNPLGGVALYAGLLRDDLSQTPPDTKDAIDHIRRIERELEHLKAIVGDFLEYARRPKPELHAQDLAPLLTDVRELVSAAAGPRRVAIEVAAEPARARCDAGQLKRALLNLAHNAVQACPDDGSGKVTLGLARRDGEVVLAVADTGPGIPSADLDRIFTPFYTTKQKGTGLGLAFVRDIARDHGARLDVKSAPGAGTTFTLAFPEARS
jgi:signal transduction histidine kinase